MRFHVFRSWHDPAVFIVTDDANLAWVKRRFNSRPGALSKVGTFPEMGERRIAFNERIAKAAIQRHGYYRLYARSFDPVARPTLAMPR